MRGVLVTLMLVAGLVGCSSDDGSGDATAVASTLVDTAPTTPLVATEPTVTANAETASTEPAVTDPAGTELASTEPASTTVPAESVTPEGFDRVRATVTTADGEVCELCLWMADSSRSRAQGLMGVTDLGDGDGMAFVYGAPHTGTFWMKNTPLPLSIAFFDEQGGYLDSFDMEPCEADPCPVYPTAPQFLVAIETVQGGLDALGIAEGSRLRLTTLACE
ncbi:hypothetical protein BDK89_4238 [Ilumatobacter fluminis]|uniref:DUF192 domain-containing protein n=1 Tax=Ilumatobacter fluminis TaxID=467091 RepID=A0A4R7I5I0_9ACTN|nr:DUF192 domain-containing protein [Ilumatobacter fluminis]TDT18610.1 hypothetical protein BDK89_4238 [Ilumatobacter fluminis]